MGSLLGKDRFADVLDPRAGSAGHRVLRPPDEAEALLDRSEAELAEAAGLLFRQEQPEGIRVLLTLRSDFMDAALSHTVLGPVLKGGTGVPLTPMSAAQLAKVIGEPVGRLPAVAYDPGLEDLILKDAAAAPGILPLLGFVLTQLWERQASVGSASRKEIGGSPAPWRATRKRRGRSACARRRRPKRCGCSPGSSGAARQRGPPAPHDHQRGGGRGAVGGSPGPWPGNGCWCCTARSTDRRRPSSPTSRSAPGRPSPKR
ncbi:hypothetical protein SMICM304S_02327 [Streptomyces microflavus]